jgi:hypothetical protein
MPGIDDSFALPSGEHTTWRQFAAQGRLTLWHSGSFSATPTSRSRLVWWADVRIGSGVESIKISEATYNELKALGGSGNAVGRHENGRPFRDGHSNAHNLTIVGSPNATTRGDSFGLFLPPLLTTPCAASHLLVIVSDHFSLDYYRKKKGDSDTIHR